MKNRLFTQITVKREVDNKVIATLEPEEQANIYATPFNIWDSKYKKGCCGKGKGKFEKYMGKIEPDRYIFEFYDGRLLYQTAPSHFQTQTQVLDFICQGGDEFRNSQEEGLPEPAENKISLTFEADKFNVTIFTPFMLINKTSQDLIFGQKKSNVDDMISVQKFTSEYFHPKDKGGQSFNIKTDGYRWSKNFNIDAIGVNGIKTLKRFEKDNRTDNDDLIAKYNPNSLVYGVIISTLPAPFGVTKTITFVPRYFIINETGRDLVVSQGHQNATKQFYVDDGMKFTYHFEHRETKSNRNSYNLDDKNLIRIRAPVDKESSNNNLLEIEEFEPEDWSSKFTIEDINEFQITFKDTPSLNIVPKMSKNVSILKSRSRKSTGPSWDNPSENNGYRRFIKVSIKATEDDGTIFIILSQPKMPQYRINNFSTRKVKFYQDNLKNYEIDRFCKPALDKKILTSKSKF